jgi:hypothetical protein
MTRLLQNSFAILVAILFVAFAGYAQVRDNTLRAELLAMRDRDQKARQDCPTTNADEQIKCFAMISESIDKPHTRRLEEIVSKFGVPDAKLVGADGVGAFYLVLQHSPSIDLKKRSAKGIKKAFDEKVLSAIDYANFTDRLLVALGKPQLYGSNFEFQGGKLVMTRPRDPKNLDARRKKLGLPPIAEAVSVLTEMYKMEVVVPKW